VERGEIATPVRLAYVEADAHHLPFADSLFEGIYCFGLLHEFVGETAAVDVQQTMHEIHRILKPAGLLILTTLAGDPQAGLPHVQLFSETMFDAVTSMFQRIEKRTYADLGCTGQSGYNIWYGQFTKV
jgi:ubiquinone/menaquinone biosynthesis C-methylase UbiE